jgi:hypothetical protein
VGFAVPPYNTIQSGFTIQSGITIHPRNKYRPERPKQQTINKWQLKTAL